MAERLINSKAESPEAIEAEIAALSPVMKRLVSEPLSKSVGYPAVFFNLRSCHHEAYAVIDAKLLESSCGDSEDKLKAFILAEVHAHADRILTEILHG